MSGDSADVKSPIASSPKDQLNLTSRINSVEA
jgi:hypothetical protein